ncbi:cytochrome c oxidase assembly protein [Saccharibacillus endophyticus]|uniref:Membrane protein n=1 Tax=Saccharibacillus endophyticus TaxID=2060666 RepID=A0ABQ1ZPM3_9BACL|nr:cytochrome c oxidase assembly protein [Saccharibacillus endophyticus]GGH71113.1 membrane protein [Saccharibacillus endophyticus]
MNRANGFVYAHAGHDHGADASAIESAHHAAQGMAAFVPLMLLALPLMLLYLGTAFWTSRRYKRWPAYRSLLACAGILACASAVAGPLAQASHGSFTAHMFGHLLLGMLGPLLLVYSAPITLLLRSLPRRSARMLTGLLRSRPAAVLTHPVIAALLNVGGLWLLYTTNLYAAMHTSAVLHALVHIHVFAAGYLFTASLLPVDPSPHRTGMKLRACVMIAAFAAHGILGKFLYASPPPGTDIEDVRIGAQLMYYGGDGVDLLLIVLFCYRGYRAAGRQDMPSTPNASNEGKRKLRSENGKRGYT